MTIPHAKRVLVTGATGRVGSLVIEELLRAGVSVRALTRRTGRASIPADVEVIQGDLTVPTSLDGAFRDVDTVFLVWTAPVDAAAYAIERLASNQHARRLRVVYLSSPHQTPHPFFQQPNPLRALHAEVERLLAAAAFDVTVLRPGMFASNVLHWWGPQIRSGNVVRWPYRDVETAPVDERDIAAVAARTLWSDEHSAGDHVLTGPQSLSHGEQVRMIGDAIGRKLQYEELSPDAFRQATANAWPPHVVEMLLGAWGAAAEQPAYVTDAIEQTVGRPARTFANWVADNTAAFVAP